MLKNLISNAVKFNRDNGRIKISSSKEHISERDFVKITVEDNGIGIPQEEMENLFRNFSPLDTSMTRKHNGAGLGLAISKGIVELHGGDIWVISEPDTGSKFIFTIPIYKKHEEFDFLMEEAFERSKYNDVKLCLVVFEIKEAQDKSEKALLEIEDIIEKTVRGPEDKITRCRNGECIVIFAGTDRLGAMAIIMRLKNSVKIPLIYGLSVFPEECSDKDELLKKAEEDLKSGKNLIIPRKILLIIDDEEDLASMLSFRLKNMGFETLTASNGNRGIELAREHKPDLILLDLMMPETDGFEVSKQLKAGSSTKRIPIVVFSALGNKNTKDSMERLGAAEFIEKPFETEVLLKKIEKVLGGA